MDATRVSLARVIELGVQIGWRAAASVLCEALAQARAAGGTSEERPPATACLLTRGGEVVLLGEAVRARPDAVVGLGADLLAACPDPDDLGTAIRTGDVLRFLHTFGERTSAKQRKAEIAAVALRGLAAEADLSLAASGPLRDDPAVWSDDAGDIPLPASASPWPRSMGYDVDQGRRRDSASRGVTGRVPAVAVATVTLAAVALLGVWLWPGTPRPSANSGDRPVASPDAQAEPSARTVGAPTETNAAPVPGPVEMKLPMKTAAEPSPQPREAAQPVGAPAPTAAGEPVVPSSPPASPPLEVDPALDDPIFPAASPGVEPPTLRSPVPDGVRVLWAEDPAGEPTLELLVDRAGRVEDVRISSLPPGADPARYRNLLAAGRRWQFAPARRDGAPVRCTVLVTVGR